MGLGSRSGASIRKPRGARAAALAAWVAFALAPRAASAATAALEGCPDRVVVGESVSVKLIIDTQGVRLGGYIADVDYTPNLLSPVNAVGGTTPPYTKLIAYDLNVRPGRAAVSSMDVGSNLPSGRVHVSTITFRATQVGRASLGLTIREASDDQNQEISGGGASCSFSVDPASGPIAQAGGVPSGDLGSGEAGGGGGGSSAAPGAAPGALPGAPQAGSSTADAFGLRPSGSSRGGGYGSGGGDVHEGLGGASVPVIEADEYDYNVLYDPRTFTDAPPAKPEENPWLAAQARPAPAAQGSAASASEGSGSTPGAPSNGPGAETAPATATATGSNPAAPAPKKDSDVIFDAGSCKCASGPQPADGSFHVNFLFEGAIFAGLAALRLRRRVCAKAREA